MKIFLVHKSYDEHHGIYGCFINYDEFFKCFKKETAIKKANLYHSYQIDEYNGNKLIDTVYVQDIIEFNELDKKTRTILIESSYKYA